MSMIATATPGAPRAPKTLEDAGLSRDLVTQLVLKTLHLSGELTGTELARRLGLPFFAIEPCSTVSSSSTSAKSRVARSAARPIATASPTPDVRARCSSWSTTTTSDTRRCRSPVPRVHVPVQEVASGRKSTARVCATRFRTS